MLHLALKQIRFSVKPTVATLRSKSTLFGQYIECKVANDDILADAYIHIFLHLPQNIYSSPALFPSLPPAN